VRKIFLLAAVSLFLASQSATAGNSSETPEALLARMAIAAERMSYNGTILRVQAGEIQTLRVAHQVRDGIVNEKVLSLNGDGFEIIRTGNEVQCVIASKQSVLLEEWGDKSTIFSTLPGSASDVGDAYDLSIVKEDRVAGRDVLLLAIRPHDQYRYGHRLWLDKESAFPLKTELLDTEGSVLDQMMFAEITLDAELLPAALKPSIDTHGFVTYQVQSSQPSQVEAAGEWSCGDLPAGFELVSSTSEVLGAGNQPVVHIMYSDGLASVSVFVSGNVDESMAQRSSVGASNSFTINSDGVQITAIGEVPSVTVERIARSMHPN
jgi:sigma-E factor negative regulatory protein RseB